MVSTAWKVFGLFVLTGAGALLGMKHQYELEEKWSKTYSERIKLEIEKEIEEENIIEKLMQKENEMKKEKE